MQDQQISLAISSHLCNQSILLRLTSTHQKVDLLSLTVESPETRHSAIRLPNAMRFVPGSSALLLLHPVPGRSQTTNVSGSKKHACCRIVATARRGNEAAAYSEPTTTYACSSALMRDVLPQIALPRNASNSQHTLQFSAQQIATRYAAQHKEHCSVSRVLMVSAWPMATYTCTAVVSAISPRMRLYVKCRCCLCIALTMSLRGQSCYPLIQKLCQLAVPELCTGNSLCYLSRYPRSAECCDEGCQRVTWLSSLAIHIYCKVEVTAELRVKRIRVYTDDVLTKYARSA